jgi:hypothetical protein
MKIRLGDLNAKEGTKDIFKRTFLNGFLQEIINDNGVRLVNFATSKNQKLSFSRYVQLSYICVKASYISTSHCPFRFE